MNILCTGAGGLLGTALLHTLSRDHQVLPLSRRPRGPECTACDLREPGPFAELLRTEAPEVVILCAAYRDPDFCEAHPDETRALNVEPVRVAVESAPASARIVFLSSDYVFRGDAPPYAESDPRDPINVYGQSKMEAEDLVLEREGSLVLRFPLLIGAGRSWAESGFVAKSVDALRAGDPFHVEHGGVRYPTWTADVAESLRFLIEQPEAQGVFHISGSEPGTKYEWVVRMARALGLSHDRVQPHPGPIPTAAPRPANSALSTERLKRLGAPAPRSFEEAVRQTVASFA